MSELRWILLAIGALTLLVIYVHGRRKRLAAVEHRMPQEANLPQLNEASVVRRRETATAITAIAPHAARVAIDDLPEVRVTEPQEAQAVPSLTEQEALSTAALDRLTITQPLTARAEPAVAAPERTAEPARPSPSPSASATAPRKARKIVALRVPAAAERFNGRSLLDAFLEQGLRHGRYGIFHRVDAQGLPIFSVASIVEPGTFDLATMASQEFPGISLFLQLSGPEGGVVAFDAMLACAQALQVKFGAGLQGERGKSLTADAIARMREDISDFEHLMRSAPANL